QDVEQRTPVALGDRAEDVGARGGPRHAVDDTSVNAKTSRLLPPTAGWPNRAESWRMPASTEVDDVGSGTSRQGPGSAHRPDRQPRGRRRRAAGAEGLR